MKCTYENCNVKINKLMLITCKCRCNNYYCYNHNLPESHKCKFNFYTDEDKKKFIDENKIIKQKVSII